MATLRKTAQDMIDVVREGIGWIAFWKDGKGWMARDFYPDYDEASNRLTFEPSDLEALRSVFRLDPEAILVNGYYCNLGDTETMDRDSLANAIRWHYANHSNTVVDYLVSLYKMMKGETTWQH